MCKKSLWSWVIPVDRCVSICNDCECCYCSQRLQVFIHFYLSIYLYTFIFLSACLYLSVHLFITLNSNQQELEISCHFHLLKHPIAGLSCPVFFTVFCLELLLFLLWESITLIKLQLQLHLLTVWLAFTALPNLYYLLQNLQHISPCSFLFLFLPYGSYCLLIRCCQTLNSFSLFIPFLHCCVLCYL